ncbi:hypothetical protein [Aquimarina algicola]|uniref:Uncharacterized protein n=1 Tax=Aquimarina algicola TaxID=2589995 RepID=A0A504JS75_9FLAO|nr:hypothetical protein [Aquimarina algicola]TPN89240.1 hypothetical protein FHK87_03160 [Aquimarina algicola]
MIKNDLYNRFINDFIFITEFNHTKHGLIDFSIANACLLAHAFTQINEWKTNMKVDPMYFKGSFNLIPIVFGEENNFEIDLVRDDLKGKIQLLSSPRMKKFIHLFLSLYIYWEQNKDVNPKTFYNNNLLNPYEPIIILYKRGGFINKESKTGGTIFVGSIFVSSSYLEGEVTLLLPSLEEGFLNYVDKSFKNNKIPTQEEIDQIYKEWKRLT